MKCIRKIILTLIIASWIQNLCSAQTQIVKEFSNKYSIARNKYLTQSVSANSYNFMLLSTGLDALQAIYIVTKDSTYLNDEKEIINNIIASSKPSSAIPGNINKVKDDYLGWISKTPNQAYNNEAVLFEGYIFQYIVRLLYQLKQSGWTSLSTEHAQWYNNVLHFTEKHIWEKWVNRSIRRSGLPYRIFLGVRTHMAAHWAGIALVLEQLSENGEIKKQCRELYTAYDTLLKRNLRINSAHPDAYIWNCTWDNTDNTQAKKDDKVLIQDVSHGNHVISYIITVREMESPNWAEEDINRFINTVQYVIYNKQETFFSDLVNGASSSTRPGWGNFQADGWLKLGRYNQELQDLYAHFAATEKNLLEKYRQSLQYYANLALNEYYIQSNN